MGVPASLVVAQALRPNTDLHALCTPQYGELPEHIRINDTDVIFEGEDKENQEYFDFDDIAGADGAGAMRGGEGRDGEVFSLCLQGV